MTGTLQMLGKPAKSDEKNHKTTYVTIKGLEQAREDVEEIQKKRWRAWPSLLSG